jgi:ABC-type spermidine/putrescine transport system permease subunit I
VTVATPATGRTRTPPLSIRWSDRWNAWWPILPVLIYLAIFMLYPVGQLLSMSLFDRTGHLTWEYYGRLLSSPVYIQVLLITFKIAAWTTVFSLLFSYPVAYLIATSEDKWRSRLSFWVLLPFWTSFLVRTFAWIILLGRNGAINELVRLLAPGEAPLDLLYNLTSVLIGMTHALMPLAILTMVSVMENIDGNLTRAALTLGARRGSTFWRIYFPLSLPGVAAGGLLVFISALGFFITPAFLGGRRETVITQIIIAQVQQLMNWPFAGAVSLLLLVATLVIFYSYDRALGLSTLAGISANGEAKKRGRGVVDRIGTKVGLAMLAWLGRLSDAVGRGSEHLLKRDYRRPILDWPRAVHWATAAAILTFLAVPALIMVPISFTTRGVIDWPPEGFSFQWYSAYWHSPQWMAATVRSFVVASGTAMLAMLIGTPAAFLLARRTMPGKTAILGLIVSPLIIPRMVIAVALFYLYAHLGLVGTSIGLIFGHSILAIPYVAVTVMAVLKTYDERLDQAAWSLGANRLQTLRLITLPLIRAGLVSAFLFAFITSFDELTIALFVTGGLTSTLPKQMWDDAILKVTPTLAAVSTLLLLFVTALIFAADKMRRKN